MVISYFGQKFLKKYNEVEHKSLTPKQFFVDIFYPLFYSNDKNLMFIQNSPFANPSNKNKTQREKLDEFFKKIENKEFDSCMFVGGYADGLTSSTSFNLSLDYDHNIDEDEIYYSWIGHALSIMLNGVNFLIDNEQILYDIYLGWNRYGQLLSDPLYVKYKGNQISTWNSHWLSNYYSTKDSKPISIFNPFEQNKDKLTPISWVRLIFDITQKYSDDNINTYAYRFGQTNETYGNVLIEIKKISGFLNFCKDYFTENEFLKRPDLYEKILGTGYSIEKICELGSIGIVALKPELLRLEEYNSRSQEIQKKINNLYKKLYEDTFNYQLYNIYIMAVLNMKDIQSDVIEIAKTLYDFKYSSRKNTNTLIDSLLSSSNLDIFMKNMTDVLIVCNEQKLPQHADVFEKMMNIVLSSDTKYSLLMNYIKCQYQLEIKNNN
jgi:hypothetical protein